MQSEDITDKLFDKSTAEATKPEAKLHSNLSRINIKKYKGGTTKYSNRHSLCERQLRHKKHKQKSGSRSNETSSVRKKE